MNDKQKTIAEHDKAKARLLAETNVDEVNLYEIADEAAMHLVQHFDLLPGKVYARDYAVIISKCYLGRDKKDNKVTRGSSIYMHGDLHEFSHDLAQMMNENKDIRDCIMHAIHIYTITRHL